MPWAWASDLYASKEDLLAATSPSGDGDAPVEVYELPPRTVFAAVVDDIYAYINERTGREGPRAFRATGQTGSGPVRIRARYRECRRSGMTHDEAVERLRAAVDWAIRSWHHDPTMRKHVNPGTIFRERRFSDRA